MSDFSERLQEAIGDESVNSFAKRCGISQTAMRSYINGSLPSIDKAQKIAETAHVSLLWLITNQGTADTSSIDEQKDTYIAVPVMKTRASAGGGAVAIDEGQDGWVKFDRAWLHNTWHLNPSDLFTIPSIGESMEPTIKAGEYLLASRSEQHLKLADGIYIIRLEGNILVKRIQVLPGRKIIISSDNPAYKPYEIKLDDGVDFDILGKVVLVHGVRKV